MRLLGAFLRRDVRHCADHSDRPAGLIADDDGAIEDIGGRSIGAVQLVLAGPARRLGCERGAETGLDASVIERSDMP